jgi:hypothetical protein
MNYDDKQLQKRIRHIVDDMGLCGCGRADKYELIRELLERAARGGRLDEPFDDISERAAEFIADVMNSAKWNLLEHGGSVRFSWMTERGKCLLAFLRDYGNDAHKSLWPEWVFDFTDEV